MAVRVQSVLHPCHELPAQFGDAPLPVPPGPEFVFPQALPHRLPRYALHTARFLSLVLRQLLRPVGITLGKVAPLYSYKVRLGYSVVDPAFVRPEQCQQHSSGSLK